MPQPYLNAISCGKKNTTIKQLERIAEALGMPPHCWSLYHRAEFLDILIEGVLTDGAAPDSGTIVVDGLGREEKQVGNFRTLFHSKTDEGIDTQFWR
jgi:hypothetical protein